MGLRKPLTAALNLSDLFPGAEGDGPRVPPDQFRIFKYGVNTSTKGAFLFDEMAAELVMAAYQAHGADLCIDYEHAILKAAKDGTKAPAAGFFVPEVRQGEGGCELWAVMKGWSDDGRADLEAGRYRYYSPLFAYDEGSGRVTRLINCALTNVPALDGLDALVAASVTHDQGDHHMEEQLKQARARIAELEQTITARDQAVAASTVKITALSEEIGGLKTKVAGLEPASTAIAALSGTIGLTATAPGAEVQAKVVALSAFQRDVLAQTGQDTPEKALGTLGAMKVSHGKLVELEAKVATEKQAALSQDFAAALKKAGEEGKISPADTSAHMGERGWWIKREKEAGTEAALSMLEAFAPAAPKQVADAAKKPVDQLAALSALEIEIAAKTNSDPTKVAAFKAKKSGAGARA